jgi:hypothetical protein
VRLIPSEEKANPATGVLDALRLKRGMTAGTS